MLDSYFYHGHIRTLISTFGSLFTGLKIVRTNEEGRISSLVQVPIRYVTADKFLDKPDTEKPFVEQFPRMTFELVDYTYNTSAINNKFNYHVNDSIDLPDQVGVIFSPAPYKANLNLYIIAKNNSDCLQIVEQILPFFKPSILIEVKNDLIEDQNITYPVTLNSISFDDNYEGSFDDARYVRYTLSFTTEVYFYGVGKTPYDSFVQTFSDTYDNSNYLHAKLVDDGSTPIITKTLINYETD